MEQGQIPYQAQAATANINVRFAVNCKPSLCKVTGKNLMTLSVSTCQPTAGYTFMST